VNLPALALFAGGAHVGTLIGYQHASEHAARLASLLGAEATELKYAPEPTQPR
jgi:hypothetical protein